jgi:hypothetical protein
MGLIGKLTAVRVAREKRAGLHSDGGGLFLQVGNEVLDLPLLGART